MRYAALPSNPGLLVILLVVSTWGLLACDVGEPSGDDDDVAEDDDAGDDDTATDPCAFSVSPTLDLEIGPSFNSDENDIKGEALEGAWPTVHELYLEEGRCRYLKMVQGFCDPPCEYDDYCNAQGECEEYPATISAGTLTIHGLGDEIILEGESWSPGLYYKADLEGYPDPLFQSGTLVTATFSGDLFPGVELNAEGVAPFSPVMGDPVHTVVGEDLVFSWDSPDPGACIELRMHGMGKFDGAPLEDMIWCVAPDTGSLTIPADLLTGFLLGAELSCGKWEWCPASEISRYSRQTVETTAGPARLTVRSAARFRFEQP